MYRGTVFPYSLLEGVATELIEARFGLKGVAAFIKLLGKIYKEEGYYLVWNKEQCMLFAHKLGNELSDEEMQEIVELLIAKDIFDRKMYEEHQVFTHTESMAGSYQTQKTGLDSPPLLPYGNQSS